MDRQAKKRCLKDRLRGVPGFTVAKFFYHLVRDVQSRNTALFLLRRPKGIYQPFASTSSNRYPEIFSFIREHIGDGPEMRILSFGCSTGEEVFSLRSYFAQAALVGLDINPHNIAVCRRRQRKQGDSNMTFAMTDAMAGESEAAYDAIFAMAVFRHGLLNSSPPPATCEPRLHFADFERTVAEFARVLRPGGLLVIRNAMFRFCDTETAQNFETALALRNEDPDPLYGSDNQLLPDVDYQDAVFRKIA